MIGPRGVSYSSVSATMSISEFWLITYILYTFINVNSKCSIKKVAEENTKTIEVFSSQSKNRNQLLKSVIHICYLPAGRSVLGKTVPEVLTTTPRTDRSKFSRIAAILAAFCKTENLREM